MRSRREAWREARVGVVVVGLEGVRKTLIGFWEGGGAEAGLGVVGRFMTISFFVVWRLGGFFSSAGRVYSDILGF
jgi:nitrogenase subunit NifH